MAAQFGDGKDAGALRTIGEVGNALDIKPHVLRYWEEQFPMLEPLKRSGNRRYYRPEDVALIETINRLVNVEGYTIKGARAAIEEGRAELAEVSGREGTGEPEVQDEVLAEHDSETVAEPEDTIEEAALPEAISPSAETEPAPVPDTPLEFSEGAIERAPRSAAANTDTRVSEVVAELRDIRARLEAAIAA